MRTALIVLLIIALAIVMVGAVNHHQTIDLDLVVGGWTGVSLLRVALGTAALVMVAGVVAALLARASAATARRKLERELDTAYRRLREAGDRAAAEVASETPEPSRGVAVADHPDGGGEVPEEPAQVGAVEPDRSEGES